MFLLDTVALSESTKSRPSQHFAKWIRVQIPARVFMSVISLGEIERGIEAQRSVAPEFAERLEAWRDYLISSYADRVLALSTAISLQWGRLAQRHGHMNADLLIAATAIEHDLTVVTRNVRHFEGTGAKVLNPFDETVSL